MKDIALIKLDKKQRAAKASQREGVVHPYNGLVSTMLREGSRILSTRLRNNREHTMTGLIAARESKLSADILTVIAARSVVDGISSGHSLQKLTKRIGSRIEDEVRMLDFSDREPRLFAWMTERFKERGSEDYRHKRRVMMAALRRANSEETRRQWTTKDRAGLGLLLLDCFQQAGMIEKVRQMAPKGRHEVHVVLAPEVEQALSLRDAAGRELLQPWFKPTLDLPLDWCDPEEGGYHTHDLPIMKTRRRQDIERLRAADLTTVYSAINALQRTPWAINDDLLVTASVLRETGIACEGLPIVKELDQPRRPSLPPIGVDLNPEELEMLREFKSARRFWHSLEATRRSKSTQALQILEIAEELRFEDRFYFPHQLDYRGRAYAVPLQLNPQGNDLAKGLLRFAEGRPLGPMGGFWLAVHGANTWGSDKGSLAGRVDWTLDNSELIVQCGKDPVSNQRWMEADGGKKPWQFLAFCFEWAAYVDSGESPDFISRLPVSLDGSCNGLQHFSAMLRDPVGATATNLTASGVQHDIYSEVASVTTRRLQEATRGESAVDRELAGRWLQFGVSRKVVKRPVMTTPYGATQIGMKEMVLDDVIKVDKTGFDFGPKNWLSATWLAGHVYGAIGETVSAAQKAMGFLQGAAYALAKEGKPIAWTTPAGLPVVQYIQSYKTFVLDTVLLGRVKLSFAEAIAKLDRRRQKTSIAPNFVHSYDAAHLMLTVVATEQELGKSVSWAMVHDSFGTHAGDIQSLSRILRQEFVRMYADKSPLEDLANSVKMSLLDPSKCPDLPTLGDFDVRDVLNAEFFFS
jgi:DNA-directed RNA polymerase